MKNILTKAKGVTLAGLLAASLPATAAFADLYKVTSTAPGMSPFVVNTAIAKVVNKHVDDVEFQVRATGAATKHMVDAGQGKVDFLFGSSTINWLMAENIGPFKNMKNAPELEKNIGMIFAYQIGPYHYVTRADSGIETLADLKGRTVFAGPPGGAAKSVVLRNIEAATGIKADEMDVQTFGFDAAIQAFQDDKIDVIILPTNMPSPPIQQFALTKKIRMLDVDIDKLTINAATGGTVNTIPADTYGSNQMGGDARTHGAVVNFSAGMHVDEEVVYQVTKAIWENIAEIHETAIWMPSTVRKEDALQQIASRLHPGAERYYREMGWEIPEPVTFGKAD
ncbi:TAXI family TRAP transporter solute-binding subunit [Neptunicoccus sediminis]|uniref:TAXI family TRAP transporter solute-binding subunit n=1 Tax=Neptunicoccus sediminis TaxID=1892596 RepID=UPI00084606F7|nr:TAXI family TRAP transporter solute-binding subunit [Neptunicoccus sediminis]